MNTLSISSTNLKQQELLSKMNNIVGKSFDRLNAREFSELSKKNDHISYFSSIFATYSMCK